MNKRYLIIGGILAFVLAISGAVFLRGGSEETGEEVILYYGEECPDCSDVDVFIEENDITDAIDIKMKDAYKSEENSAELAARAEICKIPASSLRVPFLWSGSDCIMGAEAIIGHLTTLTSPADE